MNFWSYLFSRGDARDKTKIDSKVSLQQENKFDSANLTSFVCFSLEEKSEQLPIKSFSLIALVKSIQFPKRIPVPHLAFTGIKRLRLNLLTPIVLKETLKVSQFIIFYNLYLRKKLFILNKLLSELKALCVRGLLWKRGKLFRPVTHVGLVALSVLAIAAGSVINSSQVEAVDVTEEVLYANNTTETTIPEGRPRSEVISYHVQGGDTLSTIAEKFNVSSDSVMWANNLSDPNSLTPGDVLKIPPVTGLVYTVKGGDKLEELAKKYQANAQAIVDYPFNDISDNFSLKEGQTLVIPEGRPVSAPKASPTPVKSSPKAALAADTNPNKTGPGFMWPIKGSITQYASWYHPGALDIQGPYGTPVHASSGGRVIVSQKLSYGYGWHVVIDHGNGYTSLYGHMSGLNVGVGQQVSKGEVIGWEGTTGRSTGPHVHFEVHRNGAAVNPLSILP